MVKADIQPRSIHGKNIRSHPNHVAIAKLGCGNGQNDCACAGIKETRATTTAANFYKRDQARPRGFVMSGAVCGLRRFMTILTNYYIVISE